MMVRNKHAQIHSLKVTSLLTQTANLLHKENKVSYHMLSSIFFLFQGLFILITGCFGEQKVREELLKIITGKSKGNDSTKKFTSTTYTKDN